MNRFRNSSWSAVLNAVLVSYLAVGPAAAQSIPGLGGQTQPKVMIIFDTSQSMQNLPGTNLSLGASAPSLPGRGWSYLNDDYDPTSGPDAGCDNRFCIAKNVLYNTLPVYSDSVEMGIAGFYQYRTSYIAPAGTTQCQYDVLSGAGRTISYSRTTPGLTGTVVPDYYAGKCDTSSGKHAYPVSLTSSSGGTTVTCPVFADAGTSFSGSGVGGSPACDPAVTYSAAGSSNMFFGGTSATTSNLWVRMQKSVTSCTAGTSISAYSWVSNNRDYTTGTATGVDTSTSKFFTSSSGTIRAFSTGAVGTDYADLRNRCVTGSATAPSAAARQLCELRYTGELQRDTSTTLQNFWADAGTTITDPAIPRTYTRTATAASTYTMTTAANATTGFCHWPGTTTPSLTGGETRVESTFGAYSALSPSATPNCGLTGCRVNFVNKTSAGAVMGSFSNPPVSPLYSTLAPASYTGVCSVSGASASVPWARTATTVGTQNVAAATTTCPSTISTATNAGYSWSTTAPACTTTNLCQGTAVSTTPGVTPDPTVYYSALSASTTPTLGTRNYAAGFPKVTARSYGLTVSGGAEKCVGYTGGTGTLPSSVAGCSGTCPGATYASYSASGGSAPPTQTWLSNSPASYSAAGTTYSSPTASGAALAAEYQLEKTGSVSCSANVKLTSGSTNGYTCDTTHPCDLKATGTEVCKDAISGMARTCPASLADSTVRRFCSYTVQPYVYSAPSFGTCNYNVSEHVYEQKTCSYTVNIWTPNKPTCSTPSVGGTCNFNILSYPYSYADPFPYCRATATKFNYSGTTPTNYNYSFATRGGEYLGTVTGATSSKLSERNWCILDSSRYASDLQSACPETVDASNRNNALIPIEVKDVCGIASGTGTTSCKLRWRSVPSPAGVWSGYAAGRNQYRNSTDTFGLSTYEQYNATTPRCWAPDRSGGEVATPSGVSLYAPSNQFCSGMGGSALSEIRLRSGYYQPASSNTLPDSTNVPFADSWTNQSSKASGWSRNETTTSSNEAREIFVAPAAGTEAQIKQAFRRCVRPTDMTTAPTGGLCTADINCNGTNSCQPADYTPLNGSIQNAKTYLTGVLAADTERLCRDYYVLLVTDGLESTPANYGQSDLRNSVTQLRSLPAPSGPSKDVKTFVIGFGAGLGASGDAGISDLDVIARNGGTAMIIDGTGAVRFDNTDGLALSAVNQVQLQSALNIVFSNITSGRFARSRPALGTDGNRLYVSYFERGSNVSDGGTPEWQGNVQAYEVSPTGLNSKWEFRDRADRLSPSGRVIKAELPSGVVTDFNTSNAPLLTAINSGSASAAARVVDFVRNTTTGAAANEKFASGIPRRSRVGAFSFSAPLVVSKSPFAAGYGGASSETAAASYATFRGNNATRETRVILGSYDGLLRGIRDQTGSTGCATSENADGCPNGTEAWGYVPSEALGKLESTRTSPTPIVDGPTSAADVCWPASGTNAANCTATDWRTIAVGSYRSGGKSFFALDVTDPAAYPTRLWSFDDTLSGTKDLGYTYQPPMFGRVSVNGEKRWVAFAGGGLFHDPASGSPYPNQGRGIYVLDVKTGLPAQAGVSGAAGVTKYAVAPSSPAGGTAAGIYQSFLARPSLYKRTSSVDVETAYFPNYDGQLWAMRFPAASSNPNSDWEPRKMYDPWDPAFGTAPDAYGNSGTAVGYVNKTTGLRMETGCSTHLGKAGAPNAALSATAMPRLGIDLASCTDFANRRPIFAQARVSSRFDAAGIVPDIYIGTGNSNDLGDTGERNFFYAVHDSRFLDPSQPALSKATIDGSGQLMWIYAFDKGEKIVGNPTFAAGSIIVATYKPPASGSTCQQFGDAFLYAFDPKTGAPRAALLDPASPAGSPTYKSVIAMPEAGALSDLITIKGTNQVAAARSNGSIDLKSVRAFIQAGKVQGWRRVK